MIAADVVTGLLTVLARVVAGSHSAAETRAELAHRFAPALVGKQPVDFDAVRRAPVKSNASSTIQLTSEGTLEAPASTVQPQNNR